MKPFLLVMACAFLPMQTVYYMDCCCGDFCTHKNACTGCEEDQTKPCDVHPNHQPDGDCCPSKSPPSRPQHEPHKKACSHVSPSSEVTVHTADVTPPEQASLELPMIEALSVVQGGKPAEATLLAEQVPRPAGDVPLHLLLSVLQV